MKKKFLTILLTICAAFGAFVGCEKDPETPSSQVPDKVDYASQVTLNFDASTITQEVTVHIYVDGDTTHFDVPKTIDPNGILKVRYQAVNTPESTGVVEPWGKTAANFTKEKLQSATSIVVETDGDKWEYDSNDRALVWVWYKPQGSDSYRNLNVELLQEGLAYGNKISGVRYGETCTKAIANAKARAVCVYDKKKDPNFFYGSAYEITLKELRTNIARYNGKRVAFEATVTVYDNWSIYLEDYDEEDGQYYGITAFYGYNGAYHEIVSPGSRVRMVGNVTYYEAGGTYQISNLKYDMMDPTNAENIQNLGKASAIYLETQAQTFVGNKTVSVNVYDDEGALTGTQEKSFAYAELAYGTTISMKGLQVVGAYTTHNGGDNDGAITLTCTLEGETITVRTAVLYEADGKTKVTQDKYLNKTIDVKGVVDSYDGEYQIKVFLRQNITIH